MNRLFEYIYYRILVFYHKKKDSSSQFTASLVLSLVQFFMLFDLALIARIIYEYPIPQSFSKYWALLVAVPLGYYNWRKYVKNKVNPSVRVEYINRWKEEDVRERRQRGMGVVSLIVLMIFIPIIYGFVRHNILGNQSFVY